MSTQIFVNLPVKDLARSAVSNHETHVLLKEGDHHASPTLSVF